MEFSIASITAFVTALNEYTKMFFKNCFGKDVSKFIPMFSVVYGMIIALILHFYTDTTIGSNIVETLIIGIMSGSASTGIHQIGKQLQPPPDVPEFDGITTESAAMTDDDMN